MEGPGGYVDVWGRWTFVNEEAFRSWLGQKRRGYKLMDGWKIEAQTKTYGRWVQVSLDNGILVVAVHPENPLGPEAAKGLSRTWGVEASRSNADRIGSQVVALSDSVEASPGVEWQHAILAFT